jgi:pyrroline-5-carboxylate reductase
VDNQQAAGRADIVLLAVKPQSFKNVADSLSSYLEPRQSVLSIMAGVATVTVNQGLKHQSVIRVMPNMPAQIGEGMSVWTATPSVPKSHVETARAMLKGMGEEVYVKEEKYIDMATALSGSGPAFIFLIIEALADAGVHMGLPGDMAKTLAVQTVLGSAKLAKESKKHTAELKDMVASPGGTTVEGLFEMEKGQVRASLIKAVLAAYNKSIHLAEAVKKEATR